jgi:multicomponent Na+:H+ antiporter subunit F
VWQLDDYLVWLLCRSLPAGLVIARVVLDQRRPPRPGSCGSAHGCGSPAATDAARELDHAGAGDDDPDVEGDEFVRPRLHPRRDARPLRPAATQRRIARAFREPLDDPPELSGRTVHDELPEDPGTVQELPSEEPRERPDRLAADRRRPDRAGLYRVWAGPTVFDRLVAVALVSVNGVVVIVLLGFVFERPVLFLDIALGYALLAFLLPIALGRYFEQRRLPARDGRRCRSPTATTHTVPHGMLADRGRDVEHRLAQRVDARPPRPARRASPDGTTEGGRRMTIVRTSDRCRARVFFLIASTVGC